MHDAGFDNTSFVILHGSQLHIILTLCIFSTSYSGYMVIFLSELDCAFSQLQIYLHIKQFSVLQTTYENFRYRADGRPNVYDRGCLNNFLEVFCSKIKPSRHNFRAYVQEEVARPARISHAREVEDEPAGGPRAKVEDDLEFGGDLLKISLRHNYEEVHEEMGGRNSNGMHSVLPESELGVNPNTQVPAIRGEVRNSSWGRRSRKWDISPEVLATGSSATDGGGPSQKDAH